mmetsp:Transcript_3728/g.11730  ORF Transcript_3728/g.11730 Transcript_3728/m.11730 type:complete len:252 (-) Transcript_3728:74-829(-)
MGSRHARHGGENARAWTGRDLRPQTRAWVEGGCRARRGQRWRRSECPSIVGWARAIAATSAAPLDHHCRRVNHSAAQQAARERSGAVVGGHLGPRHVAQIESKRVIKPFRLVEAMRHDEVLRIERVNATRCTVAPRRPNARGLDLRPRQAAKIQLPHVAVHRGSALASGDEERIQHLRRAVHHGATPGRRWRPCDLRPRAGVQVKHPCVAKSRASTEDDQPVPSAIKSHRSVLSTRGHSRACSGNLCPGKL